MQEVKCQVSCRGSDTTIILLFTTMTEIEITPKQEAVLNEMPATRREIADNLDISIRAVRYRQQAMEDEGMGIERDSDGVWYVSDESESISSEDRNEDPWRVNSYDKAQITKDTHNALTELEGEVKELLNSTEPVVHDYNTRAGKSTLVLPHSDAHIGATIESRSGVDYYSADEAEGLIEEYFDRAINAARERGDVEDVVLVLNGDILDGEGVFATQRHEQEDNLREQQKKASEIYIEQILKLSEEFEHVSVYCVPGNHGDISKRSTTNADMMLYDYVESSIYYSDADNVNFEKSGAGGFMNFNIRGWDYHARHGEGFLQHVGTSSGIRRALEWKDQYNFDVCLRSHYHSVKLEPVSDEVPIVMTGSPAPPSTFAEQKAANGGNCGVFWFTTDEKEIENFQPIRVKS